jgi:hypothetical protein
MKFCLNNGFVFYLTTVFCEFTLLFHEVLWALRHFVYVNLIKSPVLSVTISNCELTTAIPSARDHDCSFQILPRSSITVTIPVEAASSNRTKIDHALNTSLTQWRLNETPSRCFVGLALQPVTSLGLFWYRPKVPTVCVCGWPGGWVWGGMKFSGIWKRKRSAVCCTVGWIQAAHRIDAKYKLHTRGLREAQAAETRGLDIESLYPILRIGTAVLEQRPDCGLCNIPLTTSTCTYNKQSAWTTLRNCRRANEMLTSH